VKNWINYHHLLYFKLIAEEDSVSKAAEKLLLSQSTLSAQLKQFEEALGVKLFDRKHKKLTLTDQGKVTLDYAKNIFSLGNELYEVLSDKIVPSRVSLQVGALDSIAKQVTLQITKAAYKAGKCHVSILEGKADEIFRELVTHKLDLVITNYIPNGIGVKGLLHRTLSKQPINVYGSEKFKFLRKGFPESINAQPMILPTYDSQLRSDLEHWFKTKSIRVDSIAESQDIGLKKLMAIEGLGLIPAATHTVNRQILSGELFEIGKLNLVTEEIFLVSAQRKIENPIAKELFKSFRI
jgi:LysR family transcriptional regulator, transcriptional activator of nhaA